MPGCGRTNRKSPHTSEVVIPLSRGQGPASKDEVMRMGGRWDKNKDS